MSVQSSAFQLITRAGLSGCFHLRVCLRYPRSAQPNAERLRGMSSRRMPNQHVLSPPHGTVG